MHRVALALQPLMEERFPSACPTLLTMLSGFLPPLQGRIGKDCWGGPQYLVMCFRHAAMCHATSALA